MIWPGTKDFSSEAIRPEAGRNKRRKPARSWPSQWSAGIVFCSDSQQCTTALEGPNPCRHGSWKNNNKIYRRAERTIDLISPWLRNSIGGFVRSFFLFALVFMPACASQPTTRIPASLELQYLLNGDESEIKSDKYVVLQGRGDPSGAVPIQLRCAVEDGQPTLEVYLRGTPITRVRKVVYQDVLGEKNGGMPSRVDEMGGSRLGCEESLKSIYDILLPYRATVIFLVRRPGEPPYISFLMNDQDFDRVYVHATKSYSSMEQVRRSRR